MESGSTFCNVQETWLDLLSSVVFMYLKPSRFNAIFTGRRESFALNSAEKSFQTYLTRCAELSTRHVICKPSYFSLLSGFDSLGVDH